MKSEFMDCVDSPDNGISMRATGNYGSAHWDPPGEGTMFTAWLCDDCFQDVLLCDEYFVFEEYYSHFIRKRITLRQAMGQPYNPKVRKINEFVPPPENRCGGFIVHYDFSGEDEGIAGC